MQCSFLEGDWHRDESMAGRGSGVGGSFEQRRPRDQGTEGGEKLRIRHVFWNIAVKLIDF